MKKIVFLALIQLVIYLSGCSSIHSILHPWADTDNSLVSATKSAPPKDDDSDFYLPITTRTSLNIDVECIVDYVQGTAAMDTFTPLPNHATPWIRYQIRF